VALAVLASGLAACGGGSSNPAVDASPDAPGPPPWWQPKVGEAKNWDIQLGAPIDVSAPRVMYDLDLWALVPSPTTIDYGDGDPVMVPAGALAGTIAQLHARTPSTIVICHLETGVLDLSLPDARKFPGYKANAAMIPDNPTAPAAGSVIGWKVGSSAKRWLDIREASRDKVVPIMFKRFDLAKQIGCDGVEPDRNLAAEFSAATGFLPDGFDSYSWFAEIAKQGHARKLSTGMKNGHTLPSQTDMEADKFDWLMIERCGEDLLCDNARPFINQQKAVLAIDYERALDGTPQTSALLCPQQGLAMIADGLFKDVALTKNVRVPCEP
jgi:hypothetical protein